MEAIDTRKAELVKLLRHEEADGDWAAREVVSTGTIRRLLRLAAVLTSGTGTSDLSYLEAAGVASEAAYSLARDCGLEEPPLLQLRWFHSVSQRRKLAVLAIEAANAAIGNTAAVFASRLRILFER